MNFTYYFFQTWMSSVINFSALINHVTNENRFYERHETSCDMPPKKDMVHFIYLNRKATFNNRKLMNNLAFVVPTFACHVTLEVFGVGIIPYTCMG